MAANNPQTTGLPSGFRILRDGPGRYVLVDDRTNDPAPVFPTCEEAAATAWKWWQEIYAPEIGHDLEAIAARMKELTHDLSNHH